MEKGHFVEKKHRGYCVLLFYSAVRKMEALRVIKEDFQLQGGLTTDVGNPLSDLLFFDVGIRLKTIHHVKDKATGEVKERKAHTLKTNPLPMDMSLPFMNELWEAIQNTKKGERVFPYSAKTGYNIVMRAFKYPHLFRLSRITNFFHEGYTVDEVHSWTGLSIQSLNYYLGIVSILEMGRHKGRMK